MTAGRSGPRARRAGHGSRPDGLPSGSASARRPVPLPTAALAPRGGGGLRLPARSAHGAASASAWFPERIGTRSPDPIRLGPFPGQVTPAPRASPRARAPSSRISPRGAPLPVPPPSSPLVPPSLRSPRLAGPGRGRLRRGLPVREGGPAASSSSAAFSMPPVLCYRAAPRRAEGGR